MPEIGLVVSSPSGLESSADCLLRGCSPGPDPTRMTVRAGICGDWGGQGRTARLDQARGAHLSGAFGTGRPDARLPASTPSASVSEATRFRLAVRGPCRRLRACADSRAVTCRSAHPASVVLRASVNCRRCEFPAANCRRAGCRRGWPCGAAAPWGGHRAGRRGPAASTAAARSESAQAAGRAQSIAPRRFRRSSGPSTAGQSRRRAALIFDAWLRVQRVTIRTAYDPSDDARRCRRLGRIPEAPAAVCARANAFPLPPSPHQRWARSGPQSMGTLYPSLVGVTVLCAVG